MRCRKRTATVTKRRIAFYLAGILIVIQLAANDDRREASAAAPAAPKNVAIISKVAAFRNAGAQKSIDADHYDVEKVIRTARSLIGTPHVMGGYSSQGIDCSGLVKLAHEKVDVALPRSSHDQARYGAIITPGEALKRGDIVFFHSTYPKSELVTHTGIYLGNNEFIHASSARGVTVSHLDSKYYKRHYLFATRLRPQNALVNVSVMPEGKR